MMTIYDTESIEELRRRNAIQPHRMKQFRNALFKHAGDWEESLMRLPEEARSDFEQSIKFQCLELIERHDSKIDGASKLVFRTYDGHLLESVILRPETGRTSLCISSQVGCACHCTFCATGKMGFSRHLSRDEILDQVVQAARLIRDEERPIRNVVFMGMGEPLLNLVNVSQALHFLKDPAFFNYPGSHLMVSTVGIPKTIVRFTEMHPDVQLALSLHSARQEVRQELMPLSGNYTLEELRNAMISATSHGKVMVEYLMLAGVNDSEEDLQALINYLSGINVHINIIPFNEYEGCELQGSSQLERMAFADRLKAAGFDTTLRYSMGADIAAACGQLVQGKRMAPKP
jgi:23S rRNA (adenine2503-C2)-methyltransferase